MNGKCPHGWIALHTEPAGLPAGNRLLKSACSAYAPPGMPVGVAAARKGN